uniref:OmpH family outer membrane protein n=1 Tax=Sphingomonas bacterium TaxID=1895847 RepID=UPI001576096B
MKNILKGAAAATLLATAAVPALAQSASPVLTIDLERIYGESAAAKSAQQQLVTRFDAPNKQANAAFQAAQSSYATQVQAAQKVIGPNGDPSKLPPATQQSIVRAQEQLEGARNQALQLQQAIQASQSYVRDQIVQAVLPIAEQVRAERKAAAIAPRGALLAVDPANDVTSVVIPRLDQRLPTVQIVPPQPAAAPAAAA